MSPTAPEFAAPAPPPSLGALAGLTFLSVLPVTMLVPVLKVLVQDAYDLDTAQTSDFMAVNMIGAVLAAPLAGLVARRSSRPHVVVSLAFVADALLLLVLDRLRGEISYSSYLGVRFFEGAAHILSLSLLLGIAAGRPGDRGRTMGAMGAALTLGVAMGAPLGGVIGGRNPEIVLDIGAAVAVVAGAIAFVALGRARAEPSRRGAGGMLAAAREDRDLVIPYLFAFVDRFTVGFFVSAFPLYLANVELRSPGEMGRALAAFLLPFALLCYPAGRAAARISMTRFMGGGSLVYGLAVCLVGFSSGWRIEALMLVLGLASSVMFVPTLMLAGGLARRVDRTTAMGGFNAAGSAGFLCGPLVAGRVVRAFGEGPTDPQGYAAAFVVAGVAEILCVAAALPFLGRLERRGREGADAA
ncbi:MAG: MFS transporter [Planctomycetota bacterium]